VPMRAASLRAFVALSIMIGLPSVSLAQEQASRDDLTRRVDDYLTPYAETGWLSGTVLVARGDSVIYLRSFGMANHELSVPFTPGTPSNVASITKPMTIVLTARLAEEGKLRVSDTLSRWIPDFPRGDDITIAHLLNHRAGIPHRVTESSDEAVPHTASEMVAFARNHDLLFEPGTASSYSSAGYSVLARVLELAGGKPYGELLQTYLFEPAGMSASAHADSRMLLAGRASPYLFGRDGLINAPFQDLSFLVGAGSVFATASDLFRMQRALIAGRLGEGARTALLRQGGLAWNGSTGGYRAWADWHRDTNVTVILTANMQSGANDLIRTDLPRVIAGEESPTPRIPTFVAVDVPVTVLRRYEGVYELRPGAPMPVHVGDGGLYVDQWFLIPTSDTTFFSPQDFGTVTARFGEDGQITHFDWALSAGTYPMRRTSALP